VVALVTPETLLALEPELGPATSAIEARAAAMPALAQAMAANGWTAKAIALGSLLAICGEMVAAGQEGSAS